MLWSTIPSPYTPPGTRLYGLIKNTNPTATMMQPMTIVVISRHQIKLPTVSSNVCLIAIIVNFCGKVNVFLRNVVHIVRRCCRYSGYIFIQCSLRVCFVAILIWLRLSEFTILPVLFATKYIV